MTEANNPQPGPQRESWGFSIEAAAREQRARLETEGWTIVGPIRRHGMYELRGHRAAEPPASTLVATVVDDHEAMIQQWGVSNDAGEHEALIQQWAEMSTVSLQAPAPRVPTVSTANEAADNRFAARILAQRLIDEGTPHPIEGAEPGRYVMSQNAADNSIDITITHHVRLARGDLEDHPAWARAVEGNEDGPVIVAMATALLHRALTEMYGPPPDTEPAPIRADQRDQVRQAAIDAIRERQMAAVERADRGRHIPAVWGTPRSSDVRELGWRDPRVRQPEAAPVANDPLEPPAGPDVQETRQIDLDEA